MEGGGSLPPDCEALKNRNWILFLAGSSVSNTINFLYSKFNKYITIEDRNTYLLSTYYESGSLLGQVTFFCPIYSELQCAQRTVVVPTLQMRRRKFRGSRVLPRPHS